ncbi:MAG TPA: NAD(P)/FAD-dependent oxidoreductase [Gemmatimonas sp.]|uniref:NAD(P)/FAD-dependent oxidoreductase n=1 Tax=Gemmatimonas sp. TaxID=1962908 RepID=UPI002ED88B07
MSNNTRPIDVIVVGGGFAGLAAATYLARARRKVLVLDTGKPRNRFAHASHGFLGQDGRNPMDILADARAQLLSYWNVQVLHDEATSARPTDNGFAVTLASGQEQVASKLLLAFGLHDTLDNIPGLQERWGRSVLHCPYCHGIEFSDRPLGVLYRTPMSAHQALLIAEWGPTTLYLNGATLEAEDAEKLAARGVAVEPARVTRLVGEDDALLAIELEGERHRAIEALYVAPQSTLSSPLAMQLGLGIDDGPMGEMIRTDNHRMTTLDGVYAAGDIARAPHSVSWAVADGVTAGTSIHRNLVFG